MSAAREMRKKRLARVRVGVRWRYLSSGGIFEGQGAAGAAVGGKGARHGGWKRRVSMSLWIFCDGKGDDWAKTGEGAHGDALERYAKR